VATSLFGCCCGHGDRTKIYEQSSHVSWGGKAAQSTAVRRFALFHKRFDRKSSAKHCRLCFTFVMKMQSNRQWPTTFGPAICRANEFRSKPGMKLLKNAVKTECFGAIAVLLRRFTLARMCT